MAAIAVLTVAATVGMADLLRAPDQPLRFDKARADDDLDLDAPIATARYREPTDAQLAVVGLARIPVDPRPVEIARIDDPPPLPSYNMAQLAPPPARVSRRDSLTPPAHSAYQGPDPEALAAFAGTRRVDSVAADRTTSLSDATDAQGKALPRKVGPSAADRREGRWLIFAASSDKAVGLNLVRDDISGSLRQAGWSVERLASYGQAQVGIGWRKMSTQVSVSAARRQIGSLGVRLHDMVAGVTVSWRPREA